MAEQPRLATDRRRFVQLVGGSIVAGSAATASTAIADEHETGETDDGDGQALDEAFAWDVDMATAFTNRMQLDGDPAGEGRENVLHITSLGEESQDYPCGAVDVRDRSLTLGDVSDPGSLTYDFFKGADASYQVPDEVFLIHRTIEDDLHVTYRKEDTEATEEWQTRDVSSEFPDDDWRTIEVADEDVDEAGERITTTFDAIGDQILALREQETFADVLSEFGDDAELLAVAVGNGSVEGVVSDAYLHNLQVADQSSVIPAMLTLDADVTSDDDPFTVTLSIANPAGEEEGVTLADIDDATVQLASYTPFAPPFPGLEEYENAVTAQTVTPTDGSVDVEFDGDQVSSILDDTGSWYVFGEFDVAEPYTFVSVGTLD